MHVQPAAPARKRPFQVLPPITRGPEALDGSLLLEEVPGDLGLLLWQSLRNVRLWAEAEPESRPRLFSAAAAARRREMLRAVAVEEALGPPLEVIHALLADPGAAEGTRLSYACARVTA
ncbi:MAG TPA: hypothetical protein VFQ39_11225, partial [Longimicrobium sp.]|nr:hypothetical protein [Longimicrobium sp.]